MSAVAAKFIFDPQLEDAITAYVREGGAEEYQITALAQRLSEEKNIPMAAAHDLIWRMLSDGKLELTSERNVRSAA